MLPKASDAPTVYASTYQVHFNPLNHLRALWLPVLLMVVICAVPALDHISDFSGIPPVIREYSTLLLWLPVILLHPEHCLCSAWEVVYHPDHIVLSGPTGSGMVYYREMDAVIAFSSKASTADSIGQDNYCYFRIQTKSGKRYYVSCLLDPRLTENIRHFRRSLLPYGTTVFFPSILYDHFRK